MTNAIGLPKSGHKGKSRSSRAMKKLSLPKRDPRDRAQKQFSVKLPEWIVERLDAIAEAEAYSRNEVIREILRAYFEEWEEPL